MTRLPYYRVRRLHWHFCSSRFFLRPDEHISPAYITMKYLFLMNQVSKHCCGPLESNNIADTNNALTFQKVVHCLQELQH